ncbi:predicted protein [Lichtheimia corymbifera JMRC:FSU:9682]|uniref:Uncharacterized protein n=1 Tax=Lichtheimia corymbifera JMRC:FSU:9682 TaxID=1263082 RepID=A0A068S3S0_9FUNG|nr:predicted protein [Lichtheimia corymbifera JMRC:FSU:9682]
MSGWMQSSTVLGDPEIWFWLFGTPSAGRMDHVMWMRLRMMMDWMAWKKGLISLTKGTMDEWSQGKKPNYFGIMDKDIDGGSNQGYNGTMIPADSICIHFVDFWIERDGDDLKIGK